MARTNYVVGIIRLDATSKHKAAFDGNIGQTLSRLRAGPRTISAAEFRDNRSRGLVANRISGAWDDATVVLTANLRQLARDLEAEWRRHQRPASCDGWSDLNEFKM